MSKVVNIIVVKIAKLRFSNLCNIKFFGRDGCKLVEEVLRDGILVRKLDQEVVNAFPELFRAHKSFKHSNYRRAFGVRDDIEYRVDLEMLSKFSI
jgi:hypothetical protein